MWEAELHRIAGEGALADELRHAPYAELQFRKAIDVAVIQCAKSLQLRASTSLARLMNTQGRGTEALELLQPIYDWFTEGFETKDLKEAKALLDELS
jgi:predicted ATPase